jgi:hypothetical protein
MRSEMITASEMYWMTRLDGIRNLMVTANVAAIVLLFVLAFMLLSYVINSLPSPSDSENAVGVKNCSILKGWFKWVSIAFVLLSVVSIFRTFIPTTKEYAAIKFIPIVANSERVEKIGEDAGELYDLTVDWLKDQLKDGKK